MIDVSKITYQLAFNDASGKAYDISKFVTDLGWEESEKELAVRITFKVYNKNTSIGRLSSVIKPGCFFRIIAGDGKRNKEAARGFVQKWNPVVSNSSDQFSCMCYDEMFFLQKSSANKYYPDGTKTSAIINGIFSEWGIPAGAYSGPDVAHAKQTFKSKTLADIILDVLDDAKKKGGVEAIVRGKEGKADVIKLGTNKDVYVFDSTNAVISNSVHDISDLVTRVVVYGQADDNGQNQVESTVNGKTEFGIRQKIYTRGKDESVADAKSAADDILKESGSGNKELTVNAPDVPYIRKGDFIYLRNLACKEGFYTVRGIEHDASGRKMVMSVTPNE